MEGRWIRGWYGGWGEEKGQGFGGKWEERVCGEKDYGEGREAQKDSVETITVFLL